MAAGEIDASAARRLVFAVLLRACLDALRSAGAREWLTSEQAHEWAQLVDFERWPPRLAQLGSRYELSRRAREG